MNPRPAVRLGDRKAGYLLGTSEGGEVALFSSDHVAPSPFPFTKNGKGDENV